VKCHLLAVGLFLLPQDFAGKKHLPQKSVYAVKLPQISTSLIDLTQIFWFRKTTLYGVRRLL
jgi:hypothetical protein